MPTTNHSALTGSKLHDPKVHKDSHAATGGDIITSLGAVTFTSFPSTPSSAPSSTYHVANKLYVDDTKNLSGTLAAGNSAGAYTINMNGNKITSLGTPTTNADAATKLYVDNAISGENFWDRSNAILTTYNANDSIRVDGDIYGNASGIFQNISTESITASGNLTVTGNDVALGSANLATAGTGRFDGGFVDTNDIVSINFNRGLLDSNGNIVLDWETQSLLNTSGQNTVNWENGNLVDSLAEISVNWETRQLIGSGGSDVILDWDTDGLAQFGDNAITTTGDIKITGGVFTINKATPTGNTLLHLEQAVGITNDVFTISRVDDNAGLAFEFWSSGGAFDIINNAGSATARIRSYATANTQAFFTAGGVSIGAEAVTGTELLYVNGDVITTGRVIAKTTNSLLVAAFDAPQRIIDVADYVCDGVDDDVQILAAIAASPAYPIGAKIVLSEGNFYLSSSIALTRGSISIEGAGKGVTILNMTPGSASVDSVNVDAITLTAGTVQWDVRLSNFTIEGNAADFLNDGSNQVGRITDITGVVKGTNTDANGRLYLSVVDDTGGFFHIDFYSDVGRGALVGHTGTYNATGMEAVIADNTSGLGGEIGIGAVGPVDVNIYTKGNWYSSGISTSGTNIRVVNIDSVEVSNCADYGIYIDFPQLLTVNNCYILNNHGTGLYFPWTSGYQWKIINSNFLTNWLQDLHTASPGGTISNITVTTGGNASDINRVIGTAGIYFDSTDSLLADSRVNMVLTDDIGFIISSSRGTISNCWAQCATNAPRSIGFKSITSTNSFVNCQAYGGTDGNLTDRFLYGFYTGYASQIYTGCQAINTQNGFYILNANSIINGCRIKNNSLLGVYSTVGGNTITNNEFIVGNGAADIKLNGSDNSIVSGNILYGDGTSAIAIHLDESDYCVVSSNMSQNHDTGIQEDADCQNNIISGNNFQDSAPYDLNGTTPETFDIGGSDFTTTGVIDWSGATHSKPKIYSQAGEPNIANDSYAFWTDTDDGKYYLILDIGGAQKKIELV